MCAVEEIRRAGWGWNMAWGGLATAAWKKGGAAACGAGGAAGIVRPPAGRDAGARDAVHALSAQRGGDGGRDGPVCRSADGAARGGSRGGGDPGHQRAGAGGPAGAGGGLWRGGQGRRLGRAAAAPGAGGGGRQRCDAGPRVDAGLEPRGWRAHAAAGASDGGQGVAALARWCAASRRGPDAGGKHHRRFRSRERFLRAVCPAAAERAADRACLPEPADRVAGARAGRRAAVLVHRRFAGARSLRGDDPGRARAQDTHRRAGGALRAGGVAQATQRSRSSAAPDRRRDAARRARDVRLRPTGASRSTGGC